MEQDTPTREDLVNALDELKNSLAEFHKARLLTQRAVLGLDPKCKLPPAVLAERIRGFRDPVRERQAAEGLRDLLRLLYGREPTRQELEVGPPSGQDAMGLLPTLLPIAAIVVGGAWSLSSLTRLLTDSERRGQERLGIGTEPNLLERIQDWALPGLLAVGVGALGWYYLKRRAAPAPAPAPAEPAPAPAAAAPPVKNPKPAAPPPPVEDDEEEDDDDSLEGEDDEPEEE